MKALAAVIVAMLAVASPAIAADMTPLILAQVKAEQQIEINRAKAEELMTLKGIGEARAKAII